MEQNLKEQMNQFIGEATEEELQVLTDFFNGMKTRHHGERTTYLDSALQMTGKLLDNNQFVVEMPNTPFIQNSLNMVHGGITATLIDTAMGVFANKIIPKHLAAVTSEMKINYTAKGIGKKLTCIASIIHEGSKVLVLEGKVFRDDDKLIAHATGSFFIVNRK